MEKDMKFSCGKCSHEWKASEYGSGSMAYDGRECPYTDCNSTDISGEDIK